MKKIDNKILICEKTGLSLSDYDKIVNYLNEQGFNIEMPDKAGFIETSVLIKNTSATANKDFKTTQAENALAAEIGVEAEDLAKLGKFYANLRTEASTSSFMLWQKDENFMSGAMATFSDGRGTWENVCNKAEIDYKNFVEHESPQADNPASATTLSMFTDQNLGIRLRETKDGVEVIKLEEENIWNNLFNKDEAQKETVVCNIPFENSADRKEFISEFREQLGDLKLDSFGSLFKDDNKVIAEYATKIADEVKSEKTFLNEADSKKQDELEAKADDLRASLEKIDKNIINADSAKALDALADIRENINMQLDAVELQLDLLDKKEVDLAREAKAELAAQRAEINAELKNIEDCYDGASKATRKFLDARKEELTDKLDEVNDKYNAANTIILHDTLLKAQSKMNELGKGGPQSGLVEIEELKVKHKEAAQEAKEVASDEAKKVEETTKGGIIKIDNIIGDLKDWAQGLQEKFQETTIGKTLDNLYDNIQEKLATLKENASEFAKDVAAKGAEAAEAYQEGASKVIDKVEDFIKDKVADKADEKEVDLAADSAELD